MVSRGGGKLSGNKREGTGAEGGAAKSEWNSSGNSYRKKTVVEAAMTARTVAPSLAKGVQNVPLPLFTAPRKRAAAPARADIQRLYSAMSGEIVWLPPKIPRG